MLENG